MQRDETIDLPMAVRVMVDPFSFILDGARGKRVLNVGASGGVEHYLPDQREGWLHYRLGLVAAKLVGIDIDVESVNFAASHGVDLQVEDCETCHFTQPFDLIVMSDVIEHINAPCLAIENLARQLAPDGQLLITTPNPTHYGLVLRAWFGRRTGVYYDHVSAFMPEHFQAICLRVGLRLTDVVFFSHLDTRKISNHIRSILARLIGRLLPRCHSSFIVVLQQEKA